MRIDRSMNITVTDYNKNWMKLYQKEAKLIQDVLKNELIEIHHIGSTAVPHLKAKPVIDMMPIVKDIERVDQFNQKMIEIGYEPLGELGIIGRRYFRKGGANRSHQIHIFQCDHSLEIERHLAVRDYLRVHEDERIKYGDLKARLAQEFPNDIDAYSKGKNDFVKLLEQRAISWRKEGVEKSN